MIHRQQNSRVTRALVIPHHLELLDAHWASVSLSHVPVQVSSASSLTTAGLWMQSELLACKVKSQNAVAELETLVTLLGSAVADETSLAVAAALESEKAQHAKELEELQPAKVLWQLPAVPACPVWSKAAAAAIGLLQLLALLCMPPSACNLSG